MDCRSFFEANNVEVLCKIGWLYASWNQPIKFYLWACHRVKFFEFCMKIFRPCKFCEIGWLVYLRKFLWLNKICEAGKNLVILAFIFIHEAKTAKNQYIYKCTNRPLPSSGRNLHKNFLKKIQKPLDKSNKLWYNARKLGFSQDWYVNLCMDELENWNRKSYT